MKLSKEQVQHVARFFQIVGCGQWAAFGLPAFLNGIVHDVLLATALTVGLEIFAIFAILPMAYDK